MTKKEAYLVLGLPPGAKLQEIKKKYRKLMMQMHPDTGTHEKENYAYNVQEINAAYSTLKEMAISCIQSGRSNNPSDCRTQNRYTKKNSCAAWNAPVNPDAYKERDVLQYVEDYDGSVLGSFCIARGKYMWTTEEDFPLFLRSLYQCSKQILDETDYKIQRKKSPANQQLFQAELTYLLAQQFISHTSFLESVAKQEKKDSEENRIFYIPSMLEISRMNVSAATSSLEPGASLYPCRIRRHRLYLKNQVGQESGYLSFSDDRLYYIIVPLFEQKAVQVKIQVAKNQPKKNKRTSMEYQNLHLWIKLNDCNCKKLPENLNLQIERLLEKYKLYS